MTELFFSLPVYVGAPVGRRDGIFFRRAGRREGDDKTERQVVYGREEKLHAPNRWDAVANP